MPEPLHQNSHHIYRAAALESFAWLEHGFGTRWTREWPDPKRLAMLKQTHSATVIRVDGGSGYIGEGDALITNTPGILVGVRTADCVPILLIDAQNRAVAAVHAGWRGTALAIVARAVSELQCHFGTRPDDLWAAIGPSIESGCYEVGPEVAQQFSQWWPSLFGVEERVHLDVAGTNRRQLIDAGVSPQRIIGASVCTFCRQDFHSFRRDKEAAGRMISAVGIR